MTVAPVKGTHGEEAARSRSLDDASAGLHHVWVDACLYRTDAHSERHLRQSMPSSPVQACIVGVQQLSLQAAIWCSHLDHT